MGGALRALEEKMGLPPIREISKILSGEGGKRIDNILTRLERLSSNPEVLDQVRSLMETIHEMGQTGELEKLDSIIKSLPRGKSGETMIAQLKQIIEGLDGKLEKLSNLAREIMTRED
jgi:hypothetical protein